MAEFPADRISSSRPQFLTDYTQTVCSEERYRLGESVTDRRMPEEWNRVMIGV
jgi:hypothetical protein